MTYATTDIKRTPHGWAIRLTEPLDVEIMGCEWIPLPLSRDATDAQARAFVARLPAHLGQLIQVVPS